MIRIEMPLKDYQFLKKYYDDLDKCIIGIAYGQKHVEIDIMNSRFLDFTQGYKSMILRKGLDGAERYSDIGVRMRDIYDMYIREHE